MAIFIGHGIAKPYVQVLTFPLTSFPMRSTVSSLRGIANAPGGWTPNSSIGSKDP
jgi:hypothetical protein